MNHLSSKNGNAILFSSFCVFLFFALTFAIRSGYSYGTGLLLLSSPVLLFQHRNLHLEREEKTLILILFLVFFLFTLTTLVNGNSITNIDQSSRYLLAIPVFLVLLRYPPFLTYVWSGTITGIFFSVGIAIWQLEEGYDRVEGYLNIIHFGNIALVFGVFCIAGIFWAQTQNREARRWYGFFTLGILSSIFSIIASGSRGTWSAIPAIVILITIAFINKKNLKQMVFAGLTATFIIGILFSIPSTKMDERANDAVSDITNYVYMHNPRSSVGARLEMWHGAVLNIPRKPLFGWNEEDYKKSWGT